MEVRCSDFQFEDFVLFSQQVEEKMNDSETQENAHQVECLDIEALPSGSKQVKTTFQTNQAYKDMLRCCRSDSDLFSQVIVQADVLQGEDEDEESTVSFLEMPSYS